MYSNSCCSCSFELEIIKIGQSSHKMYSNNILNFQESTTILNACTKTSGNLLNAPRIYIYIYIWGWGVNMISNQIVKFGLVWFGSFYGISTFVSYLMLNQIYRRIGLST